MKESIIKRKDILPAKVAALTVKNRRAESLERANLESYVAQLTHIANKKIKKAIANNQSEARFTVNYDSFMFYREEDKREQEYFRAIFGEFESLLEEAGYEVESEGDIRTTAKLNEDGHSVPSFHPFLKFTVSWKEFM